jgi:D-beta-D-heptose 7-phosphate kinase/D-beta-D-heptose 1-phosphate adenosyltransferase
MNSSKGKPMATLSMDTQKTRRLIRKFKGRRMIVLGDLMLDRYIWGDVSRISPEAPVPVVEVHKSTSCLGGAGNVGQNLESLGASPLLVGIVGADDEGAWIKRRAGENRGIFVDAARPTTVKMRIIAHHQQVVRVDQEKKKPVSPGIEDRIVRFIEKENFEGIVVSDYNKGIVTRTLMERVLPFARARKIPVFVDPKVENFAFYSPVTFISPNHHEAELIVLHPCHSDTDIERAGREILARTKSRYLIIKRGEQGMSIFEKGKKPLHIPTLAREVFDVTGAGDTVIATAALALVSGATIREAAAMANAAAGVVVGKIGTAVCSPEELIKALERENEKK